jgi:hypothetical protein
MGFVKDKDIYTVTAQPEIDGEEDELEEGWDAIGDTVIT